MPAAQRAHARKVSAAFIGVGHLCLVILALTNHLAITVPSEFKLVVLLQANGLWAIVHTACAVFIAASLVSNKWHERAMGMSTAWMGAWGFFALLAATTAMRPVSYAGPILALVLAFVAYSLTMSWAVAPRHNVGE